MADRSGDLFREHRVYQHGGDALLLRVCFERLRDRKYAVCQTEFIREGDDLSKRSAEISLNTTDLLLDPEQTTLWTFYASLEEAIRAHDGDFADFDRWIAHAED